MKTPVGIARAVLVVTVMGLAVSLLPGSSVGAVARPTTVAVPPADVTPATPGYSPVSTPVFNDPLGTPEQQYAIVSTLQRNIANAPAGSVIRLVTYTYSLQRVTDDLVAAHDRGVIIQAVIDARSTRWPPANELAAALNADPRDPSFVRFAHGSTRVTGGNVHQKTWRFSQTGSARWVTMVGSTNLSNPGNEDEFSDMMMWANRQDVYDLFDRVFVAQARMKHVAQPYVTGRFASGEAWFFPMRHPSAAKDPILQRIAAMPARGARITVAQFSWWNARGAAIARALVAKRRGGAQVEAIIGPHVSAEVVGILRRGKVTLRNGVLGGGKHIHNKLMVATYVVRHRRSWVVYTGSDNWANESFGHDEAVVGARGRGVWLLYLRYLATIPRLPR